MHGAAAHRRHVQAEAELERDLFRILGQNGERARAHVAQADDSHVDFLHLGLLFHARIRLGVEHSEGIHDIPFVYTDLRRALHRPTRNGGDHRIHFQKHAAGLCERRLQRDSFPELSSPSSGQYRMGDGVYSPGCIGLPRDRNQRSSVF